MPVALERKLKAQVADKKMSKDRKDAYVYGTLRKTGWKPEREKKMSDQSEPINLAELPAVGSSLERIRGLVKGAGEAFENRVSNRAAGEAYAGLRNKEMNPYWKPQTSGYERGVSGKVTRQNPNYQGSTRGWLANKRPIGTLPNTGTQSLFMNTSKLIRLSEINHSVDPLIQFKDRDWADTGADVAAGGALAAGGYGGYKLHKAIQGAGGYISSGHQAAMGYTLGKKAGSAGEMGVTAKNIGKAFRESPGGTVGGALGILRSKLGRAFHYQSKEKPIQFESPTPISPWGGVTGHTSKIDQLEFPAGLSPASALQFPLPVLMHYLSQRNQLQQTFSWKTERLVQLSAKLDEITA